MQNKERAKLFMPFDALKGFRECLRLAEKNISSKKTISEEMENDINNKLLCLSKGDKIKVIHFYNIDYIETIGFVRKIDMVEKCLYIDNSKIDLENIIDVLI